PAALGGNQRIVQQRILQTIKTILVMTQIIFHVAAIACIVYTVCSFGLFIQKRMRKNKNTGKHVHVPPPETSGKAEPDTWEDTAYTPALKDVIDTSSIQIIERSEEHTSELQSRFDLVCRLLLEKKKKHKTST